jgi:hypothetical protein
MACQNVAEVANVTLLIVVASMIRVFRIPVTKSEVRITAISRTNRSGVHVHAKQLARGQ